ncbi:hypothetical protein MSG28_004684 [Choristoneura fumiferana]|uniref:Uncharacterized protein n=1 Tax=Choristoneura fumiferana TaxID=7141 RepID=A0ACC0K6W1_CHOFU|nr:hypothetical protein MSG28_004684 [Choristoneura fumiferana]
MDGQQLKLVGGRHVLARLLRPAHPPHEWRSGACQRGEGLTPGIAVPCALCVAEEPRVGGRRRHNIERRALRAAHPALSQQAAKETVMR